jgi:DNA-binding FadR family transcriptional regulator
MMEISSTKTISLYKASQYKASQLIASQITGAMVAGDLVVGEMLPNEGALAETFEVSRPTVREALRILEYEGLISVARGETGARVCAPTADSVARVLGLTLEARGVAVEDIYDALSVIEPFAVALATTMRPQAAAADLRAYVQLQQEQLQYSDRLSSLVTGFHECLVDQSQNKALALICAALHRLIARHQARISMAVVNPEDHEIRTARLQASVQANARLIDIIEAGDPAAAERHWRKYMESTAAEWLGDTSAGARLEIVAHPAPNMRTRSNRAGGRAAADRDPPLAKARAAEDAAPPRAVEYDYLFLRFRDGASHVASFVDYLGSGEVDHLRNAGGEVLGVFAPKIGWSGNQMAMLIRWSVGGAHRAAALARLQKAPNLVSIERRRLSLAAPLALAADLPQNGIFGLRWCDVAADAVEGIATLWAAGWPRYEAQFDMRVLGLFRAETAAPDRVQGIAHLLLINWYPNLAALEAVLDDPLTTSLFTERTERHILNSTPAVATLVWPRTGDTGRAGER